MISVVNGKQLKVSHFFLSSPLTRLVLIPKNNSHKFQLKPINEKNFVFKKMIYDYVKSVIAKLIGKTLIWRPYELFNIQDPHPLSIYVESFPPPWPWTSNFKQTIEQLHRACERTKSKQRQNQVTSHSNWIRVVLFDLIHQQWYHQRMATLSGVRANKNLSILSMTQQDVWSWCKSNFL